MLDYPNTLRVDLSLLDDEIYIQIADCRLRYINYTSKLLMLQCSAASMYCMLVSSFPEYKIMRIIKHFILALMFVTLFISQEKFVVQVEAGNGNFITTTGVHFVLNGSPFYANGFNAYWLMYQASDPAQRPKVSAAFKEASAHGLTVARTWAFGDGGDRPLQLSPGSYNNHMFEGLDFVVAEARRYGVRLILSLVDNYETFGGKKQYVKWARSQGEVVTSDDDFFKNAVVKEFYRSHVKTVLNRWNTITGVVYKSDPTIMAWELMNEARCSSDSSGHTIQAWIIEMASHVKSIDKNHMLEAGLEGFYGDTTAQKKTINPIYSTGTNFITNNQIPGIDFATTHSYPDKWLSDFSEGKQLDFMNNWLDIHIHDAQYVLQKPLLITEFGKYLKDSGISSSQRDNLFKIVYQKIYASAEGGGAAAGGLFWQLLSEDMDKFKDGYEIVLSQSPSTADMIAQQCHKLSTIFSKG